MNNEELLSDVVVDCVRDVIAPITGYAGGAVELSLTNTTNLEAWNTKYSGTYTRALAMFVDDFESVSKEAPANIAPFYGARQVTNSIYPSNDISSSTWLKNSGVTIIGTNVFLADSSGDSVYQYKSTEAAKTYAITFTASAVLNKEISKREYRFRHIGAASGNLTNVYLTDTPSRYTATFTGEAGDGSVTVGFADYAGSFNPQQVTIADFVFEEVTGQTNQNGSSPLDTTNANVTEYYNTDKNTVSYYNRLWNKIASGFSKGGSIIGDSQVATSSPNYFSAVLDAVISAGVTNHGISGNTLADIDTRFIADADPANNDFVIIQGGVNNLLFASSDPNTAMRASLESIVTKCINNGATPYIINISPWKDATTWNANRQTWTESYNNWLASYCESNGYALIDVYDKFGKGSDTAAPSEIFIDTGRLHWHEGANAYLAEAFYNILSGVETVASSVAPLTNTIGIAFAPATPHDYHFTNNKLIKDAKGSIFIQFQAQPDYITADGTVLLSNGVCEIRCESAFSGISFNDGTNNINGSVGAPSSTIKAVVVWDSSSVSITTTNGTTTGIYAGSLGDDTIYLGRDSVGNYFSGNIQKIGFYYGRALSQSEAEVLVN